MWAAQSLLFFSSDIFYEAMLQIDFLLYHLYKPTIMKFLCLWEPMNIYLVNARHLGYVPIKYIV